ncbi:MAG: precorrin-6A/cobalt-precorrin-6A reductase [Candidatus Petromonas sp.]|jgi:precorrin-6A/cobalt-precorrin-6A reductase|nr:precorrin-6A/cobalt-precorrin-6A reductase [Candidatus Petromonas sp.]
MILVLSGTKDGRDLVYKLYERNYPLVVTTATDYGKSLFDESMELKVFSRRLSCDEMIEFMKDNKIKLAIDGTHPYAEEASKNISKACKTMKIPCIRYQRKKSSFKKYGDIIKWAEDYYKAAEILSKQDGKVLLTTGSKTLEVFTQKIPTQRLVVRVLPLGSIIEKCEKLGFKPSNIIAMQGPFSKGMNMEIIKKYGIDILVTKDSGKIGGTEEKLEAAMNCGISVLMIARPTQYTENVCSTIEEVINKVSEIYG